MSEKISEWFLANYIKAVGLDDVEAGSDFKRLIAPFPVASVADRCKPFPMSGNVRMSIFLHLKFDYPLSSDGYSCVAMRARHGGEEAIYAYAYWRRGTEASPPEYICVAPTHDSRDGEYRQYFSRYAAFDAAYAALAAELAPFERAGLDLVEAAQLELTSAAFPAESAPDLAAAELEARLMVRAFAVALALGMHEVGEGVLPAHTSQAYTALVGGISAARPDLAAASRIVSRMPGTAQLRGRPRAAVAARCGQKLVPLRSMEAARPGDPRSPGWLEFTVAGLASDLVLNYVAPGLPLFNQGTYIKGVDRLLFENRAMEELYERSQAVDEAVDGLRQARRRLGAIPAAEAAELEARAAADIAFARRHLLMAPAALLLTGEHVGMTLRSIAAIITRTTMAVRPATLGIFTDGAGAAHFLFSCAFAAHALHSRLGVAHTDLHGDNITYHQWGSGQTGADAKGAPAADCYGDPLVAYVAGGRGEADTFLFPATGGNGCLIDFSRCVLGPGSPALLAAGRPPGDGGGFARDQAGRVVRALSRFAPDFVGHHAAALEAAAASNLEAVFPVLCAVDFVAIGRSFREALEIVTDNAGTARRVAASPEGLGLAQRLEDAAFEALTDGLRGLVGGGAPAGRELPGAALLPRVFAEWGFGALAKRARGAQLVDAYRLDNPLRYSGRDYALFPPWARVENIEPQLAGARLSDLVERGAEPFFAALRPGGWTESIAEEIRREDDVRDGEASGSTPPDEAWPAG